MGGECCRPADQMSQFLEVTDTLKIAQYQKDQGPENDVFIQGKLKGSKWLNTQAWKHKIYNRWFWGTWSGTQPNGEGIVYTKIFDKKSIYYEGDFFGEPNGFGKAIFNEGQYEYQGEIKNSKANGKGYLKNNKQMYEFSGVWVDSKPHQGKLRIKVHQNPENKIENKDKQINIELDKTVKNNRIIYPDGKQYYGEINRNKYIPHGSGMVKMNDGSVYSGDWQDGKIHGKGTFKWINGSEYQGDYLFGKKHGAGKFLFPSGNYYEGFWADGLQNGKGILYDKHDQELKNGYWREGEFLGEKKNVAKSS